MRLVVHADHPAGRERAERLAEALGLPLAEGEASLALVVAGERLELRERTPQGRVAVAAEFTDRASLALLRGGRRGVARALGVQDGTRVVDATAGLGRDAFAAAAAGARVLLLERHPVVAALLDDGLERARAHPLAGPAARRMELRVGDAAELLAGLQPRPEAVLIDPMYPETGKAAAKNKAMRLFRLLVGDDPDAAALLDAARRAATRRVAVKRPRRAPPLAGMAPSGSQSGTTTRFDLYAPLGDGADRPGPVRG